MIQYGLAVVLGAVIAEVGWVIGGWAMWAAFPAAFLAGVMLGLTGWPERWQRRFDEWRSAQGSRRGGCHDDETGAWVSEVAPPAALRGGEQP